MNGIEKFFTNIWYQKNYIHWLFLPVTLVFYLLSSIKFFLYKTSFLKSYKSHTPIIVVGNITTGGTGKTPFIIYLYHQLQQNNITAAIISRGYGKDDHGKIIRITETTKTRESGDEARLIFKETKAILYVGSDRVKVVKKINKNHQVDVILSDDGMQHYQMGRDMELCLIDNIRKFGNKLCLPAGPLREPIWRLKFCQHIIYQQQEDNQKKDNSFFLKHTKLINIKSGQQKPIDYFKNEKIIYAVAGIGNPDRFFKQLKKINNVIICKSYADHYQYKIDDFNFANNKNIIMTAKDMVKCANFNNKNLWYVATDLQANNNLKLTIKGIIKWIQNY
ncbi:MAG: tetraacyldisaccharide 4'-kinase [Gammaproteobacteria bacterium]|nr:MAG: tetraacyldisaccharide 4'-kinase [Gammaproteobacteria bacterium]